MNRRSHHYLWERLDCIIPVSLITLHGCMCSCPSRFSILEADKIFTLLVAENKSKPDSDSSSLVRSCSVISHIAVAA